MKIAITGHTSGLGLSFYQHFSKHHDVIGLSRSTGHDIANVDDIVKEVIGCDLFFNNAHLNDCQATLIKKLHDKLPIVTSGSMAADFIRPTDSYFRNKKIIEKVHKEFVKYGKYPMLLLKMGFLENHPYIKKYICYNEIIPAVEFWLSNPRVTIIEFDNITQK